MRKFFGITTGLQLLLIIAALAQDFETQVRQKNLTDKEWSQWAETQNMPVLVKKPPLRVLASDGFSTNLEFQIYVGSHLYPSFNTTGRSNELTSASIDLGVTDRVSVVRKRTNDNSYLLYFFTTDADEKILCLFDLNMDGVWDVKESPTRKKRYIFLEKDWLEVDKIENRNSEKPTAVKGVQKYEFQQSWKLVQ
jgi:hypothetical protein